MPSQFQPSQMSTPGGPSGAQPWFHSGQTAPVVATLQQANQQAFPPSAPVPVRSFVI